MQEKRKKGGASANDADRGLTRKEFFKEWCSRLYLKGLSYKEITDKLKEEGHTVNYKSVISYVKEAISDMQEAKVEWAQKITVIELNKINLLEIEYWQAWENSCKVLKTQKRKFKPKSAEELEAEKAVKKSVGRKSKHHIPVPVGFHLIDQVNEQREQAGDPRYLQGVQWCIEKRLELLGHTAANTKGTEVKREKEKGAEASDEKRAAVPVGKRIVQFVVNGPSETPSTDDESNE